MMNAQEYLKKLRSEQASKTDAGVNSNWIERSDTEKSNDITESINIATNKDRPTEERVNALRLITKAEFLLPLSAKMNSEIIETLRELSTDNDVEVQKEALGYLSLENDEYARRVLIDALESDEKLSLDKATILHFLSYDDHSEAISVAKKVYDDLEDNAKLEAIRVMGSDLDSSDMLSEIMLDKDTSDDLREMSAVCLQNLSPDSYLKNTLSVVRDADESDKIKASYVNSAVKQLRVQLNKVVKDETNEVIKKDLLDLSDEAQSDLLKNPSKDLEKAVKNLDENIARYNTQIQLMKKTGKIK